MTAKLHEGVELGEHVVKSVSCEHNVIDKGIDAFTTWPEFKGFLKLTLAKIGGIHEAKRDTLVAIYLRRGEVVAWDHECYFVTVLFGKLELMEPAGEIKGAVELLACDIFPVRSGGVP